MGPRTEPLGGRGRKGVAGIYARHFSVIRYFDGDVCLLSVAALPSPHPKDGSYLPITAWLTGG